MNGTNKYSDEFEEFLENIYRKEGTEGLATGIPFVTTPFVVTRDGIIVAANEGFLEMLGYDRAELYGKAAIDITYEDDRDYLKTIFHEDLTQVYNLRILTRDNGIRYCVIYPYIFNAHDHKYRIAAFIDNSGFVALQQKQIDSLRRTALALAKTIERRDPYTFGHMERTAQIAAEMARLLGLDEDTIESIYLGASIHDIGKIAVPIEILVKPTSLTHYEWDFIKSHPAAGFEILSDIEFDSAIKDIILLHHENQDGTGYPDGIMGNQIPIEVAIVTVADCLEAIAGTRPYRKAYTFEESLAIMQGQSSKFDAEVLQAAQSLVSSGVLTGREFGIH